MRSQARMISILAGLAAIAPLSANAPRVRDEEPGDRKRSPTRAAILDTGKPPMNGKREVERRLRQMARSASRGEKHEG